MPEPPFPPPSPGGSRLQEPDLYFTWQENREPTLAGFTSLRENTSNPWAWSPKGYPQLFRTSLWNGKIPGNLKKAVIIKYGVQNRKKKKTLEEIRKILKNFKILIWSHSKENKLHFLNKTKDNLGHFLNRWINGKIN